MQKAIVVTLGVILFGIGVVTFVRWFYASYGLLAGSAMVVVWLAICLALGFHLEAREKRLRSRLGERYVPPDPRWK